MKKTLLFLALFTLSFSTHAFENDLDGLLKNHVKTVTKSGIQYNAVNYTAWGKDPRHVKVRDEILRKNTNTLVSKDQKLAYWINAYNVLTIDLITREKETESIKNLGTLFKNPWKRFSWKVNGKNQTLDSIEHKIIRKLNDPRIHFAINCAAKSCPDLRKEAYRADKLNAQLQHQVNLTLTNASKGFKKSNGNSVKVSKVMDWFAEDFNSGNVNKWLQPFKKGIVNNDTKIGYFAYDWSLNKQ
ncbi:MAG: DUF547 domain-containing protein [Cocleimonas sp.]